MPNRPGDYAIGVVDHPVGEELRTEAAAFWLDNGAIASADEARRRADELLCVARDRSGEIVGVNTAYITNLRTQQDRYYCYRMFIRSQDRHMHLAFALVKASVTALRARGAADPTLDGAFLVTENPKLMRAGGNRVLAYLGWHKIGKDGRGLDVWAIEFK